MRIHAPRTPVTCGHGCCNGLFDPPRYHTRFQGFAEDAPAAGEEIWDGRVDDERFGHGHEIVADLTIDRPNCSRRRLGRDNAQVIFDRLSHWPAPGDADAAARRAALPLSTRRRVRRVRWYTWPPP